MRTDESNAALLRQARAVASPVRLRILQLLEDPVRNFPPQVDGDLVKDGVCADFIRDRLNLAAATVSRHLALLRESGFLVATPKKRWTFFKRNEAAIRVFSRTLRDALSQSD